MFLLCCNHCQLPSSMSIVIIHALYIFCHHSPTQSACVLKYIVFLHVKTWFFLLPFVLSLHWSLHIFMFFEITKIKRNETVLLYTGPVPLPLKNTNYIPRAPWKSQLYTADTKPRRKKWTSVVIEFMPFGWMQRTEDSQSIPNSTSFQILPKGRSAMDDSYIQWACLRELMCISHALNLFIFLSTKLIRTCWKIRLF